MCTSLRPRHRPVKVKSLSVSFLSTAALHSLRHLFFSPPSFVTQSSTSFSGERQRLIRGLAFQKLVSFGCRLKSGWRITCAFMLSSPRLSSHQISNGHFLKSHSAPSRMKDSYEGTLADKVSSKQPNRFARKPERSYPCLHCVLSSSCSVLHTWFASYYKEYKRNEPSWMNCRSPEILSWENL